MDPFATWRPMRIAPFASVFMLAACGGIDDVSTPALESTESPAGGGTPTLRFTRDWRATQTGVLVQGGQVKVVYDDARLGGCRGDINGHPGWSITAYASLNGAGPQLSTVAGYAPDGGRIANGEILLDLPTAGEASRFRRRRVRSRCGSRIPIGPAVSAGIPTTGRTTASPLPDDASALPMSQRRA